MPTPLKPEIEGRGGGFGRYPGLTLADIQQRFDACTADPSMRSISAVLRITREQLEARGQLGIYPILAWVAIVASMGGLAARIFGPAKIAEGATKTAIGGFAAFLLLLVSTLPTSHARRVNREQEKIIREAATAALNKILEAKPNLKPLTYEQEVTVKILMKKTANGEPLRELR